MTLRRTGSLDIGGIPIVLVIVGVFAAAVFSAYWLGNKRSRQLEAFAQSHGWNYSKRDVSQLNKKLEALFTSDTFIVTDVIEVESGSRKLVLFDYSQRSRVARRNVAFGMGTLLESASLRADTPVEVLPRFAPVVGFISDKVELGSAEFRNKLVVRSESLAAAEEILNERVQAVFLEHMNSAEGSWVQAKVHGNQLAMLTSLEGSPKEWEYFLDLTRKLEAALSGIR